MEKGRVDHYGMPIKTGFYSSIHTPENISYVDLTSARIIQPKGAYSLDSMVCNTLIPLDIQRFLQGHKEIVAFIRRIEHRNKANLSAEKSVRNTRSLVNLDNYAKIEQQFR